MSVSRRLRQALTANMLGHAITLIIQLGSVPLLLWAWGNVGLGEWLLISAIPAYLIAGDLGLPAAAANLMVLAVVEQNRPEARRIFQTTLVSLVALGPLLLLPLLLLGIWLPLPDWFGLVRTDDATFDLVLALLVVRTWFILVSATLIVAFRCDGHYAVGSHLANVIRLVEFLGLGLAALSGGGMAAAAAVTLSVQIAGLLLLTKGLRHCCPWLDIGWRQAGMAQARRLARPALSFLVFPIVNACNQQAPLLAAGLLMGPQGATALATARTLARAAQQAHLVIGASTWPEMSRAFGEAATGRMRAINRTAMTAVLWLGLLSAGGLWLLGPEIYRIWTGSRISLDQTLLLFLLAGGLVNSLGATALVVLTASNRHATAAGIMLAVSLLSIPGCYLGGAAGGLAGIALVLLLGELLVAVPIWRASLRYSGDGLSPLLASMGNPFTLYRLWRRRQAP